MHYAFYVYDKYNIIYLCMNKKCLINNKTMFKYSSIYLPIYILYVRLVLIRALKMDAVTQKAMTKNSNL